MLPVFDTYRENPAKRPRCRFSIKQFQIYNGCGDEQGFFKLYVTKKRGLQFPC